MGENYYVQKIEVTGSLDSAVTEAIRGLPKGAHGMTIIIHINGLHEIEGASIHGLPVRFDPVFDNHPAGSVEIGYGLGNLE